MVTGVVLEECISYNVLVQQQMYTYDANDMNQVQSVSYHDGNPLVEFKIGAQERYLLGSTIRLNGVLSVFKDGDAQVGGGDDVNVDPRY